MKKAAVTRPFQSRLGPMIASDPICSDRRAVYQARRESEAQEKSEA
jgi:hypothetical protein